MWKISYITRAYAFSSFSKCRAGIFIICPQQIYLYACICVSACLRVCAEFRVSSGPEHKKCILPIYDIAHLLYGSTHGIRLGYVKVVRCVVCVCVLQRTPEKFIAFGTPPPPPPNQPTLRPAHQDVFHLFHLYFFFCRQPCAVA